MAIATLALGIGANTALFTIVHAQPGITEIGIYGVMAYFVSQRTRELGIRMALGATSVDVVRMVLGQGVRLAAAGVAAGLVSALAVSRAIGALLYGVHARDPLTFIALSAGLTLVALLACYVPARRAIKVDPIAALRHE